MNAIMVEHKGVTLELNKYHDTGDTERDGWYVCLGEVGNYFLGAFDTNAAAEEAARLWVDQKIKMGEL